MQCERCGQRPAAVHQTVIVNGQKQEYHLCEVCAGEQGAAMMGQQNFPFPNLSIQQLLSSFLGGQPFGGQTVIARPQAEPVCSNCGLTYSQFADSGNLGCADCYDNLEPHLVPLIKRIHGTTVHGGKAPKRTGGLVRKRRELAVMRQQLHEAIDREQYEEAARLRDVMRSIESQIAGGEGGVLE